MCLSNMAEAQPTIMAAQVDEGCVALFSVCTAGGVVTPSVSLCSALARFTHDRIGAKATDRTAIYQLLCCMLGYMVGYDPTTLPSEHLCGVFLRAWLLPRRPLNSCC